MDAFQEEKFNYGYYEHIKMRLLVSIRGFRFAYDVADTDLANNIERGWEDGFMISSVTSCKNLWALIMDSGTGFTSQIYKLSPCFPDKVRLILPLYMKFPLYSPFIST